jgi:poly(3-hydroxybutyrate) depolymerase
LPIPLLAVQGGSDPVFTAACRGFGRQYLHLNGHASTRDASATLSSLPAADSESTTTLASGRTETVREWRSEGRLVARLVEVSGLGHAWSGGDAALAYNDAGAPDATALVGAFFADALS